MNIDLLIRGIRITDIIEKNDIQWSPNFENILSIENNRFLAADIGTRLTPWSDGINIIPADGHLSAEEESLPERNLRITNTFDKRILQMESQSLITEKRLVMSKFKTRFD